MEKQREKASGDGRDWGCRVESALETLSEEVRELSLGTTGEVERVEGPPGPLEFLRNYVLPGRPCIITNSVDHWPAFRKWSNDYLRSALRDQTVSVHFTPDGRADALVDPLQVLSAHCCPILSPPGASSLPSSSSASSLPSLPRDDSGSGFVNHKNDIHGKNDETECLELDSSGDASRLLFVKAYVEKLPFSEALKLIVDGSGRGGGDAASAGVAYAQEQNGCFLSEYGMLTGDAETHISWATEALGCMPEAVNLWIGNQHAVTSFHKDHYENLYTVVAGAKHFTLLPPVDAHKMYIKNYPSAQYVRLKDSEKFGIVLDQPPSTVPWVSVDPYSAYSHTLQEKFPKYYNGAQPFTCTVNAGETLYLPSMWFHHVRQTPDLEGRTIALNFWYDMQFDIKYAYFNMMQSLL